MVNSFDLKIFKKYVDKPFIIIGFEDSFENFKILDYNDNFIKDFHVNDNFQIEKIIPERLLFDSLSKNIDTSIDCVCSNNKHYIIDIQIIENGKYLLVFQTKEAESSETLKYVNDEIINIRNITSKDELVEYSLKTLTELFPDSVIFFNEADRDYNYLTLLGYAGVKNKLIKTLIKILGFDPVGRQFKITDDLKEIEKNQKLIEMEGGFVEFSKGAVNSNVAEKIAKILNFKSIYTILLYSNKKMIGNIHFLTLKNNINFNPDLIETVSHHIALSLEKIQNREYLFFENELFRTGPIITIKWSSKIDWKIDFISENFNEIFGYQTSDFSDNIMSFKDIILESDIYDFISEVSNNLSLKRQEIDHSPYRIYDVNRNIRWVKDHTKIIYNNNEVYFISYIFDITKEKQNEVNLENTLKDYEWQNQELQRFAKEIEEKEERMKLATNVAGVGVWEFDTNSDYIVWDEKIYEMFEVSKEEFGHTLDDWMSFVSDEDKGELKKEIKKYLDSDHLIFNIDYSIYTKKGNKKYLTVTGKITRNAEGIPIKVIGINYDITKRKLAEEKLNNNIKLFDDLLNQVPGVIYQQILDTNGRFYFPFASKGFKDVFGLTPEQIKNDAIKLYKLVIKEDIKKVVNSLNQSKNNLSEWNLDFRINIPDKGIRWLRGNSIPSLKEDGSIVWHGYINDVTNLKNIELSLIESEKKFRSIGYSLQDALIIINEKGNIEFWNPSAEKIFGYHSDEVMGKNLHNIVMPKKYTEQYMKGWTQFIKTGGGDAIGNIIELIALRKNGEEFPIEISLSKMEIKGKFWAVGNIRDITQRKQYERELKISNEKLQSSEENFRTLFESMVDMIFVTAKDGKIIYTNKSAKNKLGFSYKEFFNMNIIDLRPKNIRDQAQKVFKEIFSGKRNNCPLPLVTKDGKFIDVDTKTWFGKWDDEDIVFCISKDISEQKLAFEKYNKLFDNNPSLMAVSTHPDYILTEVNETFIRKLGYNKDELIGKKILDLNIFYDTSQQNEIRTAISHNRMIKNYNVTLKSKDGKKFDGLFTGEIIEHYQERLFFMVITDISEQKTLENNLMRAKEEAEKANNAKSEFLANMSHEIRTPMNSILGFTEIMLNSDVSKEFKSYLTTIIKSGKTLLSLINDILDLSKIEAGKLNIVNESVSVKNILYDLKEMFNQKAISKDLYINVEIANNFPNSILTDEIRLRQIFLNLIGNAVKFTELGGITIKADATIHNEENCDIFVKIIDTGIGIPDSQKEKIFMAFQQQYGQDSKKYGGTGLGLAITSRLIKIMNGELILTSEEGKGSCFEVIFRNCTISDYVNDSVTQYDWQEENIYFEKKTVLIVDDIEHNRELIVSYLNDTNLKTLTANNGADAVVIAEKYHPDLIFMDLRMPVMNGYDATKTIKNKSELSDIKIVALTASAMKSEEKKIIDLFDGYHQKPVHKKVLINEIMKFIKYQNIDKGSNINDINYDLIENEIMVNKINLIGYFNSAEIREIKNNLLIMNIYELDIKFDEISEFIEVIDTPELTKFVELILYKINNYDFEMINHYIGKFLGLIEHLNGKK